MNFSKSINNSNFTVVFNHPTEKKRTFQEVVNAFNDAKYIYISSYGITTDSCGGKNKLLLELIKQSRLKPVKVITKIRKEKDKKAWKGILDKKKRGELTSGFFHISASPITQR